MSKGVKQANGELAVEAMMDVAGRQQRGLHGQRSA
jgi:hypothetical protein